jgi:hypothetical protein
MDDLATQFIAIRQADLQTRIDYAVARKVLDTEGASGEAATQLIAAAARSQGQMLKAVESMGEPGGVDAGTGDGHIDVTA